MRAPSWLSQTTLWLVHTVPSCSTHPSSTPTTGTEGSNWVLLAGRDHSAWERKSLTIHRRGAVDGGGWKAAQVTSLCPVTRGLKLWDPAHFTGLVNSLAKDAKVQDAVTRSSCQVFPSLAQTQSCSCYFWQLKWTFTSWPTLKLCTLGCFSSGNKSQSQSLLLFFLNQSALLKA